MTPKQHARFERLLVPEPVPVGTIAISIDGQFEEVEATELPVDCRPKVRCVDLFVDGRIERVPLRELAPEDRPDPTRPGRVKGDPYDARWGFRIPKRYF
jgi:hypothetical protein